MRKLTSLAFILLLVSSCAYTEQQLGWEHRRPKDAPKPPAAQNQNQPAAVTQPQANSQSAARYKIALLVPLTGKSAHIGKSMADAAQLAVAESGNHDFEVIAYDTGDNMDADAADKAIAGGANVILGPIFSDKVGKVAAKARAAGIKVISFSNNKAVAGGNVYILGLIPDQQVARVLKYANERGINGFSAVLPNNVFGNQVAEVITKESEFFGADIRKISMVSNGDYNASAKEIADAYQAKSLVADRKSEAVLIPEGTSKAIAIAIALRKDGVGNIRLLGTALWDNEGTIPSKSLGGAWFASTPYENADAFTGRFMTKYNYKPEDIAGLSYDAVNLSIDIAASNFSDSDIHRSSGFNGVKGVYKFDGSNVDIRGYAVYEIREGTAHVADPAPDHF